MIENKNLQMKNGGIGKGSVKSLFAYFRNGTCFAFTWIVIIVIVGMSLNGRETVSCSFLLKTLLFCVVTALLFSIIFSGVFFRKKFFIFKLTLFTVLFLPIEIGYFYWIRFFDGRGDVVKWVMFVGIIVILYLISLCMDIFIFARKGADYTFKLNEYKMRRSLGEDE